LAGAALGDAGLRMGPWAVSVLHRPGYFWVREVREAVGGAQDAGRAAVEDVGVDHGGDAKAVGSTPAMIVETVPAPSKV